MKRRGTVVATAAAAAVAIITFLILAQFTVALSETGLSGSQGHPRTRFPLTVYLKPIGDPELDGAIARAVRDWNAVARDSLGVDAFKPVASPRGADVTVEMAAPSAKLMGEAAIDADDHGVIELPVRIQLFQPKARGEVSRETMLYEVAAHELGHALGLEHSGDPRSLMCCVPGSVDFKDRATREAYVEARRHPDVRSAEAQLREHYERFWKTHS